ncbi:MAG: hypothetical protein M1821_009918 [Bathelium mastoideum]|nr:MAG: hypothetical protein M1821_009918 [Bathelium mastoideum]
MSSIKQVQDLEKQLAQAKQTINQLRGMMEKGTAMNVDRSTPSVPSLNLPEINPNRHGEQKSEPPVLKHFDHVRRNIRNYGRGLFRVPTLYRQPALEPSLEPAKAPQLPPKHIADRLLSQYHGSIHNYAPLLHWPTFVQEYESVYRNGSFQGQRKIWVAMFFATLACGTVHTVDRSELQIDPEKEGVTFKETCIRYMNTWTDNITIDHARTCLLLSMFSIELNYTASGWVWLGSAIRMAQDMGLHKESGPWPVIETENRRRVWWSIYAVDRIISLELGRPLQIDDDDCDTGWPCPVDDTYIQPQGIIAPLGQGLTCGLSALIPIVRTIPQLKKTLKSPVVAAGTLDTYNDYLRSLLHSLPDLFHVENNQPIDPGMLSLCTSIQSIRMFLYRHNLSTICSREARRDAIDRCVGVGQDTARLAARSMLAPSSPNQQQSHTPEFGEYVDMSHGSDWQRRLAAMYPSMSCAHLWRCTLFLCFRGHYSSALTLVRVSAAVGDLRKNNIACGRNLRFFLDRLTERLRGGYMTQEQLEDDEEMLAYVSGDMQGGVEGSWVWAGSETGMRLSSSLTPTSATYVAQQPQQPLSSQQAPPTPAQHVNGDVHMAGTGGAADSDEKSLRSVLLTEKESTEWGGWDKIAAILTGLLEEQQQQRAQQLQQQQKQQAQRQSQGFAAQQAQMRRPDGMAVQPPSNSLRSPTETRSVGPDGTSPGGSARISIANII